MREANIHTYAKQLIHLMGPRAEAYAAKKALEKDLPDRKREAKDWERIRQAVHAIRANHVSRLHH